MLSDKIAVDDDFSTVKSGNDLIVTTDNGTTTLKSVASISVNIISANDFDIPYGAWAAVKTGDTITPFYSSDTVANGTSSADIVKTTEIYGASRIISVGGGADKVVVDGHVQEATLKVNTGAGKDTINFKANYVFNTYIATVSVDSGDDDDIISMQNSSETGIVINESQATLNVGKGNDTIVLNAIDYPAVHGSTLDVYGGEGADKITFNGAISSSKTLIDGGNDNDEIRLNDNINSSEATINGGDGDDTIVGGTWHATVQVNGGKGADKIKFDFGSDTKATIDGGDGNDTIDIVNEADDDIVESTIQANGGKGDDIINLANGEGIAIKFSKVTLSGGEGNNQINVQTYNNGGSLRRRRG